MNIKWNAQDYTSNFSFVPTYGNDLIRMLSVPENSKVIDLGCGSGALTNELSKQGFKVIGIDASEEMLKIARRHYPQLSFIQADALDFSVDEKADAVFSNAVFHWIDRENQEKMIQQVYENLKNNGEFVFEFGGFGCNNLIHSQLEKIFKMYDLTYKIPFFFPTIGEYASLLERNGFLVVYANLFDRPTKLKGENGLKDWIHMFIQTPFNEIKESDLKEKIINETVKVLKDELYINGNWYSDYVRLRMKAIKKSA